MPRADGELTQDTPSVQLIAQDGTDVLASQHLEDGSQDADADAVLNQPNEYEIQRQQNIERNRQMLADLKRKSM